MRVESEERRVELPISAELKALGNHSALNTPLRTLRCYSFIFQFQNVRQFCCYY